MGLPVTQNLAITLTYETQKLFLLLVNVIEKFYKKEKKIDSYRVIRLEIIN